MDQYSRNNASGYAVCDSCGEKLAPTATFCPNCGSRRISRIGSSVAEIPYQYNVQTSGTAPRRVVSTGGAYPTRIYKEVAQSDHSEIPVPPAASGYTQPPAAPGNTQPPAAPQIADDGYDYEGYEGEDYEDGYYDDYDGEGAAYDETEYDGEVYYTTTQMVVTVITVAFMVIVLVVALTGFIASLFVGGGSSDEYTEEPVAVSSEASAPSSSKQTGKTSKATSKTTAKDSVLHLLPDEVRNNQYERFTLEKNIFSVAMASSYIKSGNLTSGSTGRAFDGNSKTCWQDGVDGYGVDEWILAYNSDGSAVNVSSITVYNGYQNEKYNTKKKDMYKYNSRVKAFTLDFDDGSSESFTLKDEKDAQTFKFDERETCYVKFTINDVYKGSKYKDTCIGEIIYR